MVDPLGPVKSSKICFVISPIGEEGSEVRSLADDLFDIVISPVVKAHSFEVVRADKIARVGTISNDIVELIQTAALCVIDLTGHNANVYYECGRRHETGLPFIQLMRKGERLPFDLAGIRTIFYDLSTARSAHVASMEIERFISEFERSNYSSERAGTSLGSLAAAVDRIDRKVDALKGQDRFVLAHPSSEAPDDLLVSPMDSFTNAYYRGDINQIAALLPRLRLANSESAEYLFAARILATNGYESGALALDEMLAHRSDRDLMTIMGTLVNYHSLKGSLETFIDQYLQTMYSWVEDEKIWPESSDRAFLANLAGKALSGGGRHEEAMRIRLRAVDLNPNMLTYRVNLAMDHELAGQLEDALAVVQEYRELDGADLDEYALEEAIDIYAKTGKRDALRGALDALRGVDVLRYEVKSREGWVQQALRSI